MRYVILHNVDNERQVLINVLAIVACEVHGDKDGEFTRIVTASHTFDVIEPLDQLRQMITDAFAV